MRDRFVGIGDSLSAYLGELNNTSSDYDNARTLFLKTSELAKGDNEQALKDLESVSKAFLSASKARSDAEIQAARIAAEEARFLSPGGIAVLTDGNGYIADTGNHLIRHIAQGSNVSTIAGSGVAGGLARDHRTVVS